jgi:predicted RNase H-like HicB family nuclease
MFDIIDASASDVKTSSRLDSKYRSTTRMAMSPLLRRRSSARPVSLMIEGWMPQSARRAACAKAVGSPPRRSRLAGRPCTVILPRTFFSSISARVIAPRSITAQDPLRQASRRGRDPHFPHAAPRACIEPTNLSFETEVEMKIKVVVHEAEEGGFWAEVPAIPGCATQGESMEELLRNLHEAIEGCLSIDVAQPEPDDKSRVLEIAV